MKKDRKGQREGSGQRKKESRLNDEDLNIKKAIG